MATKKKLLQAAAGQAGGGGLNVEEVFSTYVYDGSSSAQTITNGIDLSGEGGMVWIKERSTSGSDHGVHDTERGVKNPIFTNLTDAENSYYNTNNLGITAFNSDGFTVASGSNFNDSGDTAVSWTFRKAPKFFDVVTYTGTGSAQSISHSLGSVPGMIIVKKTSGLQHWAAFHRSLGEGKIIYPNRTNAAADNTSVWNNTAPTSTSFSVSTSNNSNESGQTYIAYLFAHNDGDGDFGPDGDADIIKCGSYTGTGSDGNSISLGFEPQWVLVKKTNEAYDWTIFDNMRGVVNGGNDQFLHPNLSDAEDSPTNAIHFDADGFTVNGGFAWTNDINDTYIYIAIRRGPMAVPNDATDVFDIDTHDSTEPLYDTSFPVDFGMYRRPDLTQGMYLGSRMQGAKELRPNATSKEDNNPYHLWDYQNGWGATGAGSSGSYSWMWRRAPNYFDVVAYTGNGTAGRNISHNLGVAPEMIWVKRRNSVSNWSVYHSGVGNTKYLVLNTTNAAATFNYWNNTDPTATTFGVSSSGAVNASGDTYIAYLFATLAGVSKVGSYSGNGSTQTIDCGFSAGARFVLIKKTNGSGSWLVFDTERGIVSGNDPYLELNEAATQNSTTDYMDPDNSGFALTQNGLINGNNDEYIFYAIA